tara:strand:+ start:2107 stop:2406 length:300 start_codon:yes stop_codon:yes gene_type:complete
MVTCPNCKHKMTAVTFDVGYGVMIPTNTCRKCHFNVTDEKLLQRKLKEVKNNMKKYLRIIQIGDGLGVRFPNQIVKALNIKKGKQIQIEPDGKGMKLVL